jgi:hypothetical protein
MTVVVAIPAMTMMVMAVADIDDYLSAGGGYHRSEEQDCEQGEHVFLHSPL